MLVVYLQPYEQGTETVELLVAFLTSYRNQIKPFETAAHLRFRPPVIFVY